MQHTIYEDLKNPRSLDEFVALYGADKSHPDIKSAKLLWAVYTAEASGWWIGDLQERLDADASLGESLSKEETRVIWRFINMYINLNRTLLAEENIKETV